MMPQQWMENEWIAQVTTQEEEAEWSPSPAQQKLHPRPWSRRVKTFVLYTLIYVCLILFIWLVFGGNNIFYLQAITNGVVAFLVLFILPFLGLFLLIYAENDQK